MIPALVVTELYRSVATVVHAVVVTASAVSSLLVLVIIASVPNMNSAMNMLLFNLSFTDILVLISCAPIAFSDIWHVNYEWTMTKVHCKYAFQVSVGVT